MLNPTRCLLALMIVPSLAFAQATPLPGVSGIKIDAVKALPMPQGIKDLLVFRGAPGVVRPRAGKGVFPPPPIKGLASADKLALVRRAASTSGSSAGGSSMGAYLMLSRATMQTARGSLIFWQPYSVMQEVVTIDHQARGSAIELTVYPEAAGRLYLLEWQVAGASPGETSCTLSGSGGTTQAFRLSGVEPTIIPAVFESASAGAHGFLLECNGGWRFTSVEVSALR